MKLTNKEIMFIRNIAFDFIESYSNSKGEVVLDEQEEKMQILKEINIFRSLISKLDKIL